MEKPQYVRYEENNKAKLAGTSLFHEKSIEAYEGDLDQKDFRSRVSGRIG